jgi:hypothetical protein
MTPHQPDNFIFGFRRFDLELWDRSKLENAFPIKVSFAKHGRDKVRSYYKTYALDNDNRLELAYVHVYLSKEDEEKARRGEGPELIGVPPREYFTERHGTRLFTRRPIYTMTKSRYWLYDLHCNIDYTGTVRICSDPELTRFGDMFVTHSVTYQTVYALKFERGRLNGVVEHEQKAHFPSGKLLRTHWGKVLKERFKRKR